MSPFKVSFEAMEWQQVRPERASEGLLFKAGDGLFIPHGAASKHRSVTISSGTQLLMIDDL